MAFMAKIWWENRSYEVEVTVGRVQLHFPLVSENCMVGQPYISAPDLLAWNCTLSVVHEHIPDADFIVIQNLQLHILFQCD